VREVTNSLWDPFEIRGSTLRNRLGMAPMCLYRSPDGNPTPWHVHHCRERSYGVGLTLVEATALAPATRVSPQDLVLHERSDPAAWRAVASGITEADSPTSRASGTR
jgi:2,4-dienoyl-CoA reductase-like NADH-dependent reductase (Old Yellow Enzyme family)